MAIATAGTVKHAGESATETGSTPSAPQHPLDPTSTRDEEHEEPALEGSLLRYASPEAVFRAHYTRLVRALTVAGDGDPEAAADAVQEAFARLLVDWGKISTYDDPAAWVRRVALNNLHGRRRSLVRRTRALLRLSRETDAAGPPADAHLESNDTLARLRHLPERQRAAVALHYVGGLTVNEAAAAMGISAGAVNQHLHRARAALRATMEAER